MSLVGALGFAERKAFARRGRQLEQITLVWGVIEAAAALCAAHMAGSISLAGFGLDSLIEVVSATAILWRMSHEMDHHRRHEAERVSLTIAGWCLLSLAVYVSAMSLVGFWRHQEAEAGWLGISITVAALLFMPLLSHAERKVGIGLGSAAMMTDAKQTDFCMYQAGIVLCGLIVHRLFGISWADNAAALLLVPLLVRAGILALRGVQCCAH